MDGQMCWMKEARVVRIIGERRIGLLCRNWRFRFDPEDDTHMPLLPLPYAEIPMVLGFSGWHPCLSVTNRLVDRRQFGSLVRSLARPLPVVVHSLVQSPTRSRARSLPPFSSLSLRIPITSSHWFP